MGIERALPRRWKYQHAFRHYIDGLIVNSSVIRDRWLESAPWFAADEVHVVLNGVSPSSLLHSTLRSELGIGGDAVIICAAGRLEERKGFDVLLHAFALGSVSDAHLVIAGEGSAEGALRALSDSLGVSGRVHFLGFRSDMDNVLVGADVFVLSSRIEGMANVMLEAMAADCLIVATDISGVREAIGEFDGRPRAGWIVPVGDADAMAASITAAVASLQKRSPESVQMRTEMKERIETWFSPQSTVVATERILRGGRDV
jgi:glycosyltransferase involved in cell wall biosynthesis